MNSLSALDEDELCDLYWKLRDWNWDERMGAMPVDFDNIPVYVNKWNEMVFRRKSKEHYVKPYRYGIEALVSREKLQEFRLIHIEKRSPEDVKRHKDSLEKFCETGRRARKVGESLISSGLIK